MRAQGLTPTERRICELLVQGYTNRELMKALDVSEGTIKTQLSRVYDKLHVRGRTEAAIAAVRMGIGI